MKYKIARKFIKGTEAIRREIMRGFEEIQRSFACENQTFTLICNL